MRKLAVLLSVFVTLLTFAAAPRKAVAVPVAWRETAVITKSHVTYRLRNDGIAVVTKTHGKLVVIPKCVRHNGKTYRVRNIWTTALKDCKVVYIKANLEGCDCARVWRIKVYVAHKSMLRWLRGTGANVERL